MLNRGLQELEELFPALRSEILAAGGVDVPTPHDWTIFDDRMGGKLTLKYTAFNVRGCCGWLVGWLVGGGWFGLVVLVCNMRDQNQASTRSSTTTDCKSRSSPKPQMLSATRPLVETELRMRVARDCPNVKTLSGALVEGLEFGGGGAGEKGERVTGERAGLVWAPWHRVCVSYPFLELT
jgi:hypothetical protein